MKPNSPYGASKAAADRLCYSYYRSYGLDVTIVRPFNIFGVRQKKAAQPDVSKDAEEGARDAPKEAHPRALNDGKGLRRPEIGTAGIKSGSH